MTRNGLQKLKTGLRNAFSLQSPYGPLTDQDRQLLGKIAGAIVKRGMAMPAVLFLAGNRPLNGIGSQAMVFLRPFVTMLIKQADYDRLTEIVDRREGIGALIDEIEAFSAGSDETARHAEACGRAAVGDAAKEAKKAEKDAK
jgi:hypothetical protein